MVSILRYSRVLYFYRIALIYLKLTRHSISFLSFTPQTITKKKGKDKFINLD